jgi:hypothetical protein
MEKILSDWIPIEGTYIWDEYDLVKAFEKRKKEINMTEQTIKFRDPVVQCVVNKFVDRSDVGFAKYKTTMRDDQSDVFVWLNHLQEELMDATLYLQRLKEEISTLREEKALLNSMNDIDVIDAFVFEIDKKKQSKDTLKRKKRKNGHGRNWTIDEDDVEVQHDRFKHFASDKNPFEGFHTTFTK